MKRGASIHLAIVAASVVAITSCSSPANEPGYLLVGDYLANETITINIMGAPPQMMHTTSPVQVRHGNHAALVLDDGMCLLPADAMGDSMMTVHSNVFCSRLTAGGTVQLTTTDGTGAIAGAELTITVHGTFSFTADMPPDGAVAPDGGMSSGMGMFTLEIHGTQQ